MRKQVVRMAAAMLVLAGCSPKTYQAMNWQQSPVAVDGANHEWGEMLRYYDKSSKMFYEISNDQQNLYFALSTSDQASKQKIMQKGLTFGIDLKGKEHYSVLVQYPVKSKVAGQSKDSLSVDRNALQLTTGNSKPDFSQKPSGRQSFGPMVGAPAPGADSQIKLLGFNPEIVPDSVISVHNPYGIQMSMSMQDSTLFIEAKLPFNTFYKDLIEPADTLKPIGFEFVLSALTRPGGSQGSSGEHSGGVPSGMSGGPGGGMGGPGGMGGFGGGMGGLGGGMGGPGGGMGGPGGTSSKTSGGAPGAQKSTMDYAKKEIRFVARLSQRE